jgi:DNA-binding PadR family transcriptional regulator
MAIHHAVLGLLVPGPSYGYQLKASFEEAIGPQWGSLNIGHLYQVLDRLVRDGLVTRRTMPRSTGPDRVVYRLTPKGRDELQRWLGEASVREAGYRDDFFLKLFVASRTGEDELREVVRLQRETYLQELADLGSLRKSRGDDPLVRLLIEAAILRTTASLRVAELAGNRAKELTRATISSARRTPRGMGRTRERRPARRA